jgi:predicted peptidase
MEYTRLHGSGERGDDNEKQLRHGVPEFASPENRKKYPCFLAAPQCPAGAKWVDVDWSAEAQPQPEKIAEPLRLALELTKSLREEFSVDPGRVYVTGLSMGGYGTWDAITRRPEDFAAAVPICGGGDPSRVERIARVPIWVFHGARDPVVKPSRSRDMVVALMTAGGAPGYTQYPDVAHESWVPAYREPKLFEWLFAQKRK